MADSGLEGGFGHLGEYQGVVPFKPSVSGALTFVSFWHSYVRQSLTLLR